MAGTELDTSSDVTVVPRVKPADELPFKTLAELMEDYFAHPDDDHVCSMDAEPPKYFYYRG